MQNVTPRKGGGGNLITPKVGGGDRNKTPEKVAKSGPTDRPHVRSGSTPRTVQSGGQTSVKENFVDSPAQPPRRN